MRSIELRSGFETLRLSRTPSSRPHSPADLGRYDLAAISSRLARFVGSESELRKLRAALSEEIGDSTVRSLDWRELVAWCARLIHAGVWSAQAGREQPAWEALRSEPVEDQQPERPSEIRPKQLTWVEVELLDMEGKPIAGQRYWVKTPDGVVHEGRLDTQGRVYIGQLQPGDCEVCFPDLDASAYQPSTTRAKTADLAPPIDAAAQAAVLIRAAASGVPFCEECERRRRLAAA